MIINTENKGKVIQIIPSSKNSFFALTNTGKVFIVSYLPALLRWNSHEIQVIPENNCYNEKE